MRKRKTVFLICYRNLSLKSGEGWMHNLFIYLFICCSNRMMALLLCYHGTNPLTNYSKLLIENPEKVATDLFSKAFQCHSSETFHRHCQCSCLFLIASGETDDNNPWLHWVVDVIESKTKGQFFWLRSIPVLQCLLVHNVSSDIHAFW